MLLLKTWDHSLFSEIFDKGFIDFCRRPTALQDRTRDSDDDDFRDRDYDVAALASNLSQAFRYGIYSSDDIEEVPFKCTTNTFVSDLNSLVDQSGNRLMFEPGENATWVGVSAHGSLGRDDEKSKSFCSYKLMFGRMFTLMMNLQKLSYLLCVWVMIRTVLCWSPCAFSGSLFTNSNWFAFEDDKIANERSTGSLASPSPNTETGLISSNSDDEVIVGEDDDFVDTATSSQVPELEPSPEDPECRDSLESPPEDMKEETVPSEGDKPPEWVQWRETSDSGDPSDAEQAPVLTNGELEMDSKVQGDDIDPDSVEPSLSSTDELVADVDTDAGGSPNENPSSSPPEVSEPGDGNLSSGSPKFEDVEMVETEGTAQAAEHEKKEAVEDEAGK
ncbi:hypothetical protein HHK36_004856 [Tetracentron sinense]|uniref:Uncharacterized protein n=1 Tax=Tetracentron sinense TaxID=13715 RepID=A0A834ZUG5_TETSI|nr:hypothetical protein HHK36_004856 [Tetracentron sinense]